MNEDKATRYHRLKRQASVFALAWTVVLLAGLLLSGGSATMRDLAEAFSHRVASGGAPALALLVYLLLVAALHEVGGVLFGFYRGFLLERRYGLSNERLRGWLFDRVKAFLLALALAWAGAGVVYGAMWLSPERWWLLTGAAFALCVVGFAIIAPLVILPIFYSVRPLRRESLRLRLLALADRAGARVLGAYEWGLAEKTNRANAALMGIGGTRRILVSDTMLAEYSDDEIEVVLAHELGHHVHGDIWKGVGLEMALVVAGCYVAAWLLGGLATPLGLRGAGDLAGLPLLVLAAGGLSLAMGPIVHAVSRACERSADRFALRLTGNPTAFISVMRRLAAQNLAEEHPSTLVRWLFHSHPPINDRIAAARAFKN